MDNAWRMAVLFCGCFLGPMVGAEDHAPPNMIILMADDLGYGDLGCTGSKQIPTPSIDRLAAEGVFCSRAYVTAPMCAPSRMGLMTGRFPKRFGITTNPNVKVSWLPESHYGLPQSEKLIPQYLKPFGYRSAIFGKWHLGHTSGYRPEERGFDRWWGFLGGSRSYFPTREETKGLNPTNIVTNGAAPVEVTYLTEDITDRAVAFLQEVRKTPTPFFLLVSYNAPHWPLEATPEDLARFKSIRDRHRRTYCAMVHAMDRGIGRILQTLEQIGQKDNTIVVFLSDNGGAPEAPACNAPFRGAKRQHFEGGVRVPFILRYPADKRLIAGTRSNQPVSTVDLLPTLLKANGAAIPGHLDGRDILELLSRKGPRVPRTFFWCTDYTSAVLDGDRKYLLVPNIAPGYYNLADDPQEQRNLYFKKHTDAASLAQKLGDYLTSTPACRYPDTPAWSAKLLKEYGDTKPDKQPE